MDKIQQFYATIRREMTATLATAAGDRVTMRLVSPVLFENAVLIFTDRGSNKYRQLEKNPHCCLAAGMFFAEAEAEFRGATTRAENAPLRDAYREKFPDAFDEGVAFGGLAADFLLLHPRRLTGWAFPDGAPDAEGVPTVPFAIELP